MEPDDTTTHPGRGVFVTLEGPDGAGKSILCDTIVRQLGERGLAVTVVREPGGTPLGEAIRTILMDGRWRHSGPADALLFNAARAQLVAEVIRPALDRGDVVICDRYADSTLAYQGYGSGVELASLRALAALSTGGLTPDRTILFDVPVGVGLERRRQGPSEQQTRFEDDARHDRAFHDRVLAGYRAMAAAEPQRWRVVDATQAPERVLAAALAVLDELLGLDGGLTGEPAATVVRTP